MLSKWHFEAKEIFHVTGRGWVMTGELVFPPDMHKPEYVKNLIGSGAFMEHNGRRYKIRGVETAGGLVSPGIGIMPHAKNFGYDKDKEPEDWKGEWFKVMGAAVYAESDFELALTQTLSESVYNTLPEYTNTDLTYLLGLTEGQVMRLRERHCSFSLHEWIRIAEALNAPALKELW